MPLAPLSIACGQQAVEQRAIREKRDAWEDRMHSLKEEVKDTRTRMSRAHFDALVRAKAGICFACRGVAVTYLHAPAGNARDGRERRCPLRSCRAEAVMPIEQAAREGWVEVTP